MRHPDREQGFWSHRDAGMAMHSDLAATTHHHSAMKAD
jgi:hypothetical protein